MLATLLTGCSTARDAQEIAASAGPCPRAMTLDREAIARETACRLAEYVRIDTQNPGKGERAAALYLHHWLAGEGIDSEVLEPQPGRANLVARLRGRRSDGALLLLHHMDVVPAAARDWSVPPFAGVERDGFVWGRGSLDDKGPGIIQFLAALLMHRLGVELEHDLVLLAVADEEAGGALGARFVTSEHPELLRGVEYVLNEGGAIVEIAPGRWLYSVEVSQKAPLWLKLTARGTPGHASTPHADSAVPRLVRALANLSRFEFPIVVTPQVDRLFAAKAASLPAPLQAGATRLGFSMHSPAFRTAFLDDPRRAALVRNTLAITMLDGSDKENVIPAEASAVVDLRLLPGEDPDDVTRTVARALGDPAIEVTRLLSWRSVASSGDSALFREIQALAARRDSGAPVLANVIAGFTDCNAFRAMGTTCLGFTPIRLRPESFSGVHGTDERIEVAAMADAVVALADLIRSMIGDAATEASKPDRAAAR